MHDVDEDELIVFTDCFCPLCSSKIISFTCANCVRLGLFYYSRNRREERLVCLYLATQELVCRKSWIFVVPERQKLPRCTHGVALNFPQALLLFNYNV